MTTFTLTPDQTEAVKVLKGPARRIMLVGGSRSGKTFLLLRSTMIRALKEEGSQHCIGRLRFNHAISSIAYQTMPMVLARSFPKLTLNLNRQHWFYQLPNGSQIWLFGYDQKDRIEKILGTEWCTMWVNEASMVTYDLITTILTRLSANTGLVNKLYLDQNPPVKSHWTYKLFHEKKDPETNLHLKDADNWDYYRMNPAGNVVNLPADYIQDLQNLPERKRKRFWLGEYQDEIEGALWNDQIIDRNRIEKDEMPGMVRIVIAVDPATTHGPNSDDTGIVVAGKSEMEHYYVLEYATGKYTPGQWASKVVMLYYKWSADRVIGEGNQGGEMVRSNINNVDPDIKVDMVHAKQGKLLRAEPVSGLYEQDRVHHVGSFPKLEEQMTHYTGEPGQESPNNLDACVYALSELKQTKRKFAVA
jgi:PBSX family phage terminase large subunit